MEKHPELQKLAAKGITAKYLTRRCKEVAPGWRVSPLREKKAFTGPQKKTRLTYALDALKRPLNYWLSTIFVDEHTFYRRPTALPAIHIAGQRRKVSDRRLKRWKWAHPKLHFMYGVHWKLGVLGPYWVHDCTGWKHARKWKVSSSSPPERS